MSLHKLNLNLLPVLRELLNRRSITDAGFAVGRSASAISQGLTQLREMFDDPLLVRTAGRMVLTPRAEALIEPVEEIYQGMQRVLLVTPFDPRHTARDFVIAATEYDAFAHGPAIAAAIRPHAPAVRVRYVDVARDLHERITAREIDFALMPDFLLGELAAERLQSREVALSVTVVLMRAGHPLADRMSIDRADLERYDHVAFYPSWASLERRWAIAANRTSVRIHTVVAQATALPYFLAGTDDIALVPDVVAERLGPPLDLIYRPLTKNEPVVRSVLAWSMVQDADPAHRWFRNVTMAGIR